MGSRGGKSQRTWDEVKRSFLSRLRDQTGTEFLLERTNARWAWGPPGIVGILSAEERPRGGGWFMGFNEKVSVERQPLGVFLLCEARDGRLLEFGFGASRWAELAQRMSRGSSREELKIDVRRRGGRSFLAGTDVTSALGDLSWLGEPSPARDGTPPAGEQATNALPASRSIERRFFARVSGGTLEPLDPTELSDGDVVLVSTRPAPAVPSNATLRRVIAAGGPSSLPPDFADQHDAHAHGAPAR